MQRLNWVDIARGIGIILVVYGHSGLFSENQSLTYIYWFHMPLFFILSGYLFKPVNRWSDLKSFVKKRSSQLLIPYAAFLVVFAIVSYAIQFFNGNYDLTWYLKDFVLALLGGRFSSDFYTVFWFITCLYASQIGLALIQLIVKTKSYQIVVIILCYILAHVESLAMVHLNISPYTFRVPWNLDVALLAIVYLAIGYYAKPIIDKVSIISTIFTIVITCGLIALDYNKVISYHLDLKSVGYTNIILDLIIPITMSVAVIGLSKLFDKIPKLSNILIYLGISSLLIMYLHFPINMVLGRIFSYNDFAYVLIGIIPALLFGVIINRINLTKQLFIGK